MVRLDVHEQGQCGFPAATKSESNSR
jgi:hypothetical protein